MAITLSELILHVRAALADVTLDMVDDSQVYHDIKKAYEYVQQLVPASTISAQESYVSSCIVNVAAYYTYVNYTSLAERQQGTLPPTALIRINALREIALTFLTPITPFKLNPDLSIDESQLERTPAIAFGLIKSILED